jgi:hypothetical protein
LPGDEIFSSVGGWIKVTNGTWLSERQTDYNFKVEGYHAYFVGLVGAWVHNGTGVDVGDGPKTTTDTPKREGWNEPWYPAKNWNGPRNHGNWEGPRGNANWIDTRPEGIRIVGVNSEMGKANPIVFHKRRAEFLKYKSSRSCRYYNQQQC